MASNRPPPPCDPKCELRTAHCHATCERFEIWRGIIDADNAKREEYWAPIRDASEERRDAVIRAGRKNKAKKAR